MCYSWQLLSWNYISNYFKKLLITSLVLREDRLLYFETVRLSLALVPVPGASNTSRLLPFLIPIWPCASTTTNAATKHITTETFFCSSILNIFFSKFNHSWSFSSDIHSTWYHALIHVYYTRNHKRTKELNQVWKMNPLLEAALRALFCWHEVWKNHCWYHQDW